MQIRYALVAAALVAACSKKSSAPSVDLATAVNAKVPAALASTLKFETRTIEDRHDSATAAVPVGWTADKNFPGRLQPPKTPDLGFMTGFNVGSTCDGMCEPKDWKAVIDKAAKQAVPDGPDAHVEALPNNGTLRWQVKDKEGLVYAAWYKDGASRYQQCTVWLQNEQLVAAIDAFVLACKTAQFD